MQKVTVYTREHGTRKLTRASNRKEYHKDTIFVLRYAGRWETLDVADYHTAWLKSKEREIELSQGKIPARPVKPSRKGDTLTLAQEVDVYLSNVLKLAPKTHKAYSRSLTLFQQSCTKQWISEITKQDLQAFDSFLLSRGDEDRTRSNRVQHIVTFLKNKEGRRSGKPVTDVSIRVKYVEAPPEAYTRQELDDLFRVSDEDERFCWRFFLGTGFRESEAAVAEATDVNPDLRPSESMRSRSTSSRRRIVRSGWCPSPTP